MRKLQRAGAVLAATVVSVGLAATPATAEVTKMYDAAGDSSQGRYGDIRTVRVKHGPHQLRVTVGHGQRGRLTDVYLVWIDTDARRPGPEFLAGGVGEVAPDAGLQPARGWARQPGTEERCGGQVKARYRYGARPATVKLFIPRECLGTPKRVRVGVASEPDYPFRRVDWAPGKHRFGPWVRSS